MRGEEPVTDQASGLRRMMESERVRPLRPDPVFVSLVRNASKDVSGRQKSAHVELSLRWSHAAALRASLISTLSISANDYPVDVLTDLREILHVLDQALEID